MMMPLPGHIHEEKMIEMIHPDKDMDGLTTVNAGRLFSGKDGLFGGTPRAVMAILKHYGISVEGKHAVIIGRSNVCLLYTSDAADEEDIVDLGGRLIITTKDEAGS